MFGIFIVACGTTHVLDIWTIWHPAYWLSGTLKAVTAIVSLTTVVMLVRVVPAALALRTPEEVVAINAALAESAEHDRVTTAKLADKNRLMAMAEQMVHVGHWRHDIVSNEQSWSEEVYRTFGVPTTHKPTLEEAIAAYHPDES